MAWTPRRARFDSRKQRISSAARRECRDMVCRLEPLEGRRLFASTSYYGTPFQLPATIQAEDFDKGGQGVAYYDATVANQGGQYRTADRVDIEGTTDAGGGYDLDYVLPGEYENYTVNVPSTGAYNFAFRLASVGGGTFHVAVDGQNATGAVSVGATGGFQNWTTVTKANVNLTAGQHVLAVTWDTANPASPYTANFNWMAITAVPVATPPTVNMIASDANAAEQNRDPGEFTFARTGDANQPLTVPIVISGTATNGSDYNTLPSSITFPAGQGYTTLAVTPIDDSIVEGNETVIVSIGSSSAYTLGSPSSATVTIADNDVAQPAPPTVTIAATDPNAAEQNLDPGVFTVTRTGSTAAALTVSLNLGGTATNGSDYNTLGSTLTIPAGASSATLTVTPIDDALVEGNESVIATLAASGAYTVGSQSNATVTIADNDVAQPSSPTVTITATDPNAAEQNLDPGVFTITRTGSTAAALTVTLNIAGTATNGSDYNMLGSTLTIPAGAASATLTVTPIDDSIVEGNESVIATLAAGSAYTVGSPSNATVTIADNDTVSPPPPTGPTPFTGTPANIAGQIEFENYDKGGEGVAYHDTTTTNDGGAYRPTEGVDVEAASDTGGGYDVGYARAGEWLGYTVNVNASGNYDFDARVANVGAGGAFHVEVDGVNVTGALAVPNTGGFQTYADVVKKTIPLTAGQHFLKVVMDGVTSSGFAGNFNWMKFTPSVSAPPPPPAIGAYGGTPWAIAGQIEAENYDLGGEGVAYHDMTTANEGGAYRTAEGVDVETASDTGGGYDVAYTHAGEWLRYTVNVTTAGNYDLDTRVANLGSGGAFHVEVDGVNVTGMLAAPDTGAFQKYTDVIKTAIPLTAGQHLVKLVMDGNAPSGFTGNFNWLKFTASAVTPPPAQQTPFGNTPWAIPGSVEAENYDNGGEGVAYHDTTTANEGGSYRTSDGVDVELTGDTGSGYDVGWTHAGEWLAYTVNVASAGTYALDTRVANAQPGATFHVTFNGSTSTGAISVPNTGGFQTYTDVVTNNVSLAAGTYVMKVFIDAASANGFAGNFNRFTLTKSGVSTPPPVVSVSTTGNHASEAGPVSQAFTISRSGGDTTQPLVVNYTLGGTATNGSDYTTLPGSVTIPANALSATVTVAPIDDALVEGSESVSLTLAAGSYQNGATASGNITIDDNDTGSGSQPDLLIRNYGQTDYSGGGVINQTGLNQIVGQDQPFFPSIFQVRVTNTGAKADSFVITGPASTNANWRIWYYDSQVQGGHVGGGQYTTDQVTAGGWNTGVLQPGESKDFRFEVGASPLAPADDSYIVQLKATSASDPSKSDVVEGKAFNDPRWELEVRRRNYAQTTGESGTYLLDLQNYGNLADNYTVKATGSGTGYTVKYFDAYSNGNDVTAQVTGSGWTTSAIGFHSIQNMAVQITSTDGKSHSVQFTVTSNGSASVSRTITISNVAPASATPSFFPIGVWDQPSPNFDTWKGRGINTLVQYDGYGGQDTVAQWTQYALDKGLYVIRQPSANPQDDVNDSNLLAWMQPDEPELNGYSVASATNEYNTLKSIDPNIPVYVNFDASDFVGWQTDVSASTYQQYIAETDWVSGGMYPISGWNRPDDLDVMGRAVDRMEAMAQGAPTYAIIESSNQQGPWLPNGTPGPTGLQVQAQVWDSVIHGARGIIYFPQQLSDVNGFQYDATPPDVAAAMTKVNAQITSIGAALEGAIDPPTLGVTANTPLEATWRTYNGHNYYIVFNNSNATTTQQLTLTGVGSATSATVQGENRNVALSSGTLSDTFAPYQAHIYVV